MSTTNATTTATEKALGILLPCPCCGESDASISLDLSNADMRCNNCDGEFTLDSIKAIMARWGKIVVWIESMPSGDE